MDAADRNIDRLVLVHAAHVLVDGDLGRSVHHDPMLGAMKVLLQRQLIAGLHHDPLDAIAAGNVDVLIVTPRPVDTPMLDRGAVVLGLDVLDQRFHLLRFRARRDQDGVGGRDHDDVVEPDDGGEQRFLGAHEAVAAVQHDHRTVGGVAVVIVIEHLPDRAPAADV